MGLQLIVGAILAVVFALAVFGGSKKISQITEVLVPIMGIFYLAVSLFIILKHYQLVPVMFTSIFNNAFDVQAIFGGFAGSCVMHGIKRGLFSNEAGVGSAPNAAASAAVSHPGKTRTCADAFCIHRHYPDLLRNSVHASLFRRRADF